jgi:hypothetical protein
MVVDLIDVYQYHSQSLKNSPKIPLITLVLKYIYKFANFVAYIILSQIYTPYVQVFQCCT